MLSTSILRIFAIVCQICLTVGLIQHGYMTHYYYSHKPVFVNDSMILELTNRFLSETPGERYLTCDVNIVTSASRKLMIHFLSLEISYADKDIDRLHIYDYLSSGEAKRISPAQGLYGISDRYYTGHTQGVADYVSSGNRLKLDYQGKPTLAYNGFKILITAFRDGRGDCGRGYLRCGRKDMCIPASTWCDGNPNCGEDDGSDEVNCDTGPLHTWNPLDGQVTAVVAAAVACTAFFITAALLTVVVLRLNKRDIINQNNITVEFKKKKTTKRQASKTGDYAPPSYEVVIGMREDPPPYQLVASPDDTGSDVTDEEDMDGAACGIEHEYVTIAETSRVNENIQECSVANINNIRVTCDIHGGNLETTDVAKQNGCQPNGDIELPNYRLCSQVPASDELRRQDSRRGKSNSLEIEVLNSDSESEHEEHARVTTVCNSKAKTNGIQRNGSCKEVQQNGSCKEVQQNGSCKEVQQNGGCKEPKLNGHARVSYSANPEASSESYIEFNGN